MDIFDLIGPIMVGPSSSHTAGAVRIGLVARKILGEPPTVAHLGLHGSFADTGQGHGTDQALIAGLLGMAPDDRRIPMSFELARQTNLAYTFEKTTLRGAHPNSVRVQLTGQSGKQLDLIAASIGGGRIEIRELDGIELSFSGEQPTLIVTNEDQPGCAAEVTRVLAEKGVNIATFQMNRSVRGGEATMVIVCDAEIYARTADAIRQLPGILSAIAINP